MNPETETPEGTPDAQAPSSRLPEDALQALTEAVARGNAAVWAYGLIAAYDTDDPELMSSARTTHLARRDQAAAIVNAGGGSAPSPAPAYSAPEVKDVATARSFAVDVEDSCATAWFAVIGNTDIPELRLLALAALTDCATTTTRLRMAAESAPFTRPFPGRPA